MTPLDLTKTPPRSPREELRGLCMLPRMIDIARAMAPGERVNDYEIGREKTLSAVVLGVFGMSVPQFVQVVRDARTEDDSGRAPLARSDRAARGADCETSAGHCLRCPT